MTSQASLSLSLLLTKVTHAQYRKRFRASHNYFENSTRSTFAVLRQDPPLEAILVIFGRRALLFFWKLLEKMKNDATFVRMRTGDHLGDTKMSKTGASLRRI